MDEVHSELRKRGIPSLEVLGTLENADVLMLFGESQFFTEIQRLYSMGKARAELDIRQVSKRGLPLDSADHVLAVPSHQSKRAKTPSRSVVPPVLCRNAVPSLKLSAPKPLPEEAVSVRLIEAADELWALFQELGAKGSFWPGKHMSCVDMAEQVKRLYLEDWSCVMYYNSKLAGC